MCLIWLGRSKVAQWGSYGVSVMIARGECSIRRESGRAFCRGYQQGPPDVHGKSLMRRCPALMEASQIDERLGIKKRLPVIADNRFSEAPVSFPC